MCIARAAVMAWICLSKPSRFDKYQPRLINLLVMSKEGASGSEKPSFFGKTRFLCNTSQHERIRLLSESLINILKLF